MDDLSGRRAARLGGRAGLPARTADPGGAAGGGRARRHRLRRRPPAAARPSPASQPSASAGRSIPAGSGLVADVMSAVAEVLRALTERGRRVVVNPPIYPPFRSVTRESAARVVEAPLVQGPSGWRARPRCARARLRRRGPRPPALPPAQPDRDVVRPRASSPPSPELAARYGVLVVSDEVHAPMTHAGRDARAVPLARPRGGRARARDHERLEVLEPRRPQVRGDRHRLGADAGRADRDALPKHVPTTSAISACSRRSPPSRAAAPGSTR